MFFLIFKYLLIGILYEFKNVHQTYWQISISIMYSFKWSSYLIVKAILIGINIINSTCACYIYKAGSRPKIYIATTINTWKMLSTTIWADKKYASFWPISKNLKQYCNLDFNLEFSIQSIMYFQKIEKRKNIL